MNLMLDLETLGTDENCVVLSLGAVLFDNQTVHSSFYSMLNPEEQLKRGRSVTWSTIKWWTSQSSEARDIFNSTNEPVLETLKEFISFTPYISDTVVWGNGSSFDVTIMENLLKSYDLSIPWNFWNIRDLRTFKDVCKTLGVHENLNFSGNKHTALDDATNQANYVIHMLDRIGNAQNPTEIKERA